MYRFHWNEDTIAPLLRFKEVKFSRLEHKVSTSRPGFHFQTRHIEVSTNILFGRFLWYFQTKDPSTVVLYIMRDSTARETFVVSAFFSNVVFWSAAEFVQEFVKSLLRISNKTHEQFDFNGFPMQKQPQVMTQTSSLRTYKFCVWSQEEIMAGSKICKLKFQKDNQDLERPDIIRGSSLSYFSVQYWTHSTMYNA